MAKTTFTWYTALVKIFIGLATIMGLAVMVVCAYDMVETFQDSKLEVKIRQEIYLIEKTNSKGYEINGYKYELPDEDKYVIDGHNKTEVAGLEEFHGAKTYRIILLLCLGSAIILGFVQFISSAGVVCSCSPDIPRKVKTWLAIHLFVYLLGILCIVVPLSYNPGRGTHLDLPGFSGYLKNKIEDLTNLGKVEDFHKHLFFYFLGANEALLLISLVLLGALLRCGTQPYESVY